MQPSGSRRDLARTWVRWVTAAELAGFAVPGTVGVLVALMGAPAALTLATLVLAGAVEGAVLGAAQARVARRVLPALDVSRWIALTAAGAALAWTLGMLPSTSLGWWSSWPAPLAAAAAAPLGVALLLSVGAAQWVELRRHVARAGRWVVVTALAWLLALAVFFLITSPLWHEGQSAVYAVAVGLGGGVAMAATMAVVTGLEVARWQPAAAPAQHVGGAR